MSGKAPLKVKDVERGLAALGFEKLPTTATSHAKWQRKGFIGRKNKPHKWVVTVDAHLSPFHIKLIKSMAKQAGLSEKQLREICTKDGQKKARNGQLLWLKNLYGKLPDDGTPINADAQ